MNVLSLFDGCGVACMALKDLNIPVDNYFASEIDKYAIRIALKNHPEIIQLGDAVTVKGSDLPRIDLLIGGSPCQDLSAAGNTQGLYGDRSVLFFDFVRLLKETKPRYFLFENVFSMKQAWKDLITKELGVEPVLVNSALVSAQMRKRLYWTNIPFVLPIDRGILLKDIIESGVVDTQKSYCIDANYWKGTNAFHRSRHHARQIVFKDDKSVEWFEHMVGSHQLGYIEKNQQARRVYSLHAKSVTLKANAGNWGGKTGLYLDQDHIRKLTPIECERLQTLPDNYTEGVSNTQRYKMLGNAFTCDVISHILSFMELDMVRNDRWYLTHQDVFTPFVDHQVKEVDGKKTISYGLSSAGYDIRLSPEFVKFKGTKIDPKEYNEFYRFTEPEMCVLEPHDFVLAQSLEWIKVPKDCLGVCYGKSTYARCGLVVNVTPLEPGWEGHLTIELSNTTDLPIVLYVNEGIAQIVLLAVEEPAVTYDRRNGKYMNQTTVTLPTV